MLYWGHVYTPEDGTRDNKCFGTRELAVAYVSRKTAAGKPGGFVDGGDGRVTDEIFARDGQVVHRDPSTGAVSSADVPFLEVL